MLTTDFKERLKATLVCWLVAGLIAVWTYNGGSQANGETGEMYMVSAIGFAVGLFALVVRGW